MKSLGSASEHAHFSKARKLILSQFGLLVICYWPSIVIWGSVRHIPATRRVRTAKNQPKCVLYSVFWRTMYWTQCVQRPTIKYLVRAADLRFRWANVQLGWCCRTSLNWIYHTLSPLTWSDHNWCFVPMIHFSSSYLKRLLTDMSDISVPIFIQ